MVYEILRRFGAWAVASRLSLLGTKECLQQPTWISVRYGLLNLKKIKKFYFKKNKGQNPTITDILSNHAIKAMSFKNINFIMETSHLGHYIKRIGEFCL